MNGRQIIFVPLIVAITLVAIVFGLWQSGITGRNSSADDRVFEHNLRTRMRYPDVRSTEETGEILKLIDNDEIKEAEERIDEILERDPADIQGRFLRGVVLAEQGKTEQAIEAFKALISAYPELPEPYNNLAVLYAANHQYEQARDTLLGAINTHTSYATAYQNLSDIYAIMAGMAYDRALELWKEDEIPETSLAMITSLPPTSTASPEPMDTGTGVIAAVDAEDTPSGDHRRTEQPPHPEPPEQAQTPPASSVIESPVTTGAPELEISIPTEKPVAQSSGDMPQQVIETVTAWAQAWAAQDAETYLSFYAPGFQTPVDLTRPDWEQVRRQRISFPAFINITVSNIEIDILDTTTSRARFIQIYQSPTFRSTTNKNLLFTRVAGQWKIIEEAVR